MYISYCSFYRICTEVVTGAFWRSPVPLCQTLDFVLTYVPCEMGLTLSARQKDITIIEPDRRETKLTLVYSSQTSVKNALIPSSFLASCRSMNFMSVRERSTDAPQAGLRKNHLTAWGNKRGYCPFIELIHGFQIPLCTNLSIFLHTTRDKRTLHCPCA